MISLIIMIFIGIGIYFSIQGIKDTAKAEVFIATFKYIYILLLLSFLLGFLLYLNAYYIWIKI